MLGASSSRCRRALLVLAFNFTCLTSLVAAISPHGSIVEPTAGSTIAPGAKFNFTYNVLADYSVSSFWYHVWLLDPAHAHRGSAAEPSMSALSSLSSIFNTGYYFGRYDYPNYPGKPMPALWIDVMSRCY